MAVLKIIIVFILLSIFTDQSRGLKCYLDTVGILPPQEEGEAFNVSAHNFREFDCNLIGKEEKVNLTSRAMIKIIIK